MLKLKDSSTFSILLTAVTILVISKTSARVYGGEDFAHAVRAGYYIVGSSALYCLTVHVPRMVKGIYATRKVSNLNKK